MGERRSDGRVYRLVTRFWPRIAAALVALAVVAEWVIEGLTAGGALEIYAFAWAATTGGLWFMFEKAEAALSDETRAKVVGWLERVDFRATIESIPLHFAILFDRVFGEKHWSRQCFSRSCVASLVAALTVWVGLASASGLLRYLADPQLAGLPPTAALALFSVVVLGAVVINFLPDYVSLLETRWLIGRVAQGPTLVLYVVLDLLLTAGISLAAVFAAWSLAGYPQFFSPADVVAGRDDFSPFFYSAFFTSVWLWLYALSVVVTGMLVRVGGGVGFLLRMTDVKKQPFRSVGFTAVVIVSVGFLIGLPFVLAA